MLLGPVMLGLDGIELSDDERELLRHPLVGGVILFSRNYETRRQLVELTRAVRKLRPALLIAVDQEGGRVQRFREEFSVLPAPRDWGQLYDADPPRALKLVRAHGRLLALELNAAGVDFSFAPVLDLDCGRCAAIGDRALHARPDAVAALGEAFVAGMTEAGMAAVVKHFPGHGHVAADSHHELPVDPRPLAEIERADLYPFGELIDTGVAGVMSSLVVYSDVDERPACFSSRWLRDSLRDRFGFRGTIFSDDLGMAAADYAGGPLARAEAALAAGCDVVLACNDRDAAWEMLDGLGGRADPLAQRRLAAMRARRLYAALAAEDPSRGLLKPYLRG